jgi:hypothetical protein
MIYNSSKVYGALWTLCSLDNVICNLSPVWLELGNLKNDSKFFCVKR